MSFPRSALAPVSGADWPMTIVLAVTPGDCCACTLAGAASARLIRSPVSLLLSGIMNPSSPRHSVDRLDFRQGRAVPASSTIAPSTTAPWKPMPSDIEIAQAAKMRRISAVAREKLGIPEEHLEPYGHYKAKVHLEYLDSLKARKDARLILVTAMTPTPAGEGKTTTTVGLGDALNHIGKKAMICLREPSLGPVFGVKGGAAGGGYAQVVPMEDINLHFTGDIHAVTAAHNLLAAVIDNHLFHGNGHRLDPRRVLWKRVLDINDRALRSAVIGLGGPFSGVPR